VTVRAKGFYEKFERKDGNDRTTHYCAGCGHGIIHKLIAEAIADLDIQDDTVFVNPVGCASFCYYYIDCGHVAGPHGRAAAVATGLSRVLPNKIIIAYQGDGDLGAIGFNNAFQAANRGEHFAHFFINNALYAMTGGQMAPTTLPGQKTATTPYGRDVVKTGEPLKVSEIFNQLERPVYIERVSVADTKRIMQARKAIRKALQIQKEGKGYAFVEFLSPCPTNMHLDPIKAAQFITEEMERVFPLGCFRDRSEEEPASCQEIPRRSLEEIVSADYESEQNADLSHVKERLYKLSGFGGQGILSLGLVIADAASLMGRHVSWFPSYGPEQRGGSASCSVVISGKEIGSPIIDHPDVLIAMNQPSLEKFLPTVKKEGVVIYEASIPFEPQAKDNIQIVKFPAIKIAADNGVPKAANTAMLGCMTELGLLDIPEREIRNALERSFASKPKLIESNMRVFDAAKEYTRQRLRKNRPSD